MSVDPRPVASFAWTLLLVAAASAGPLEDISHRDKLYDIAVRGDDVFVVGYPGLLLHSSDRGGSWNTLDAGTNDALFAIDFNSQGQGIIVGRGGLVLTSRDGGKTWKREQTGIKEHLFDVTIIDSGKAWAVGHFGTIIHSPDAGATWQPQEYEATFPEGTPEEEMGVISEVEKENESAHEARLNAVAFSDELRGLIVGEFGIVLRTEDGGQTWKRQPSASGKLLFDLVMLEANRGIAVGAEGTFMQTEDGGAHWRAVDVGTTQHILGLWPQGEALYLVGTDGTMIRRKGEASEAMSADLFTWLNAVRFVDGKRGFIAGGRGYLLMTTDAGANWQRLSGR